MVASLALVTAPIQHARSGAETPNGTNVASCTKVSEDPQAGWVFPVFPSRINMNQLLNYRFKMKAVGVFFDPFGPFFWDKIVQQATRCDDLWLMLAR